jgi:hypothetical protein
LYMFTKKIIYLLFLWLSRALLKTDHVPAVAGY